MSSDGDLALTRLASYSSASNMPVSSRLSFTSYSSYAPRTSSFRASSLERGAAPGSYSSSITGKMGSSSRLTPGVGYSSSSRRPPLPTSDARRVAAARASPGRPPPGPRREPSTDPDTLTEARRYLQERRDRLTRSESREPSAGSALRALLSSSPATESASRLLDRMDAAADASAPSSGTLSRRWRSGDAATSPTAPRERVVPITLATERRTSVGELRRQFDASRLAESRGDEESPAAKEAAPERVIGGRVEVTRPSSPGVTNVNGIARTASGSSGPDKEPASPVGRRSLLYDRDSTASTSRRLRADQEGHSAAGGRGASQRSSGSDTSRTLGLTGLRNIGNTCFMNSVLQCLSNTRALHDYILRDSYTADINTSSSSMKGALIKAFASLMCDLWRSTGESDRVLTTAPFKSQVQRFAPRFMGYQQQDAQEFLRYLLEGLHEDVNRVTSRPKPITTDIDENLSASQMSMEAWKRFLRLENSKFVDLFVGQLKSTLRCTVCGHASMTFDPFWDLSLPIPSKSGQLRLQSCFDLFTKEEVLDGDEKPTCSKCKKRQKCTKAFSIQKFPRILVVHLKRFSPMERFRGKLGTAVDFPVNGLDLSQYSAGSGPCKYNLYGVANHSGTLFSGHYTAHCKHPHSGEWYEYNDARVRPVTTRTINSAEAYVLFFELSGTSHL